MASPLQTAKQPVDLAAGSARPSRIRRDPPPRTDKKTVVPDRDERDQWTVTIGVLAFTLAIVAIIAGFSTLTGWSPSDRVVHIRLE